MAQVLVNESSLEDIGDAIREKNESSDTYLPSEMGSAIRAIRTGGDVTSVNGKTGAVVLSASDVGAGTYSKPSGGIPKSDLASAVQTSLGKADTALQTAPVTSVNGKMGAVNITPADIGAKATQSAVSSPSASGTEVAFIDTISQDAQGVISATKKTVREATSSQSGLMSADDKVLLGRLDGKIADDFADLSYPAQKRTIFFDNDGSLCYLANDAADAQSVVFFYEPNLAWFISNNWRSIDRLQSMHSALETRIQGLSKSFAPNYYSGLFPVKAGQMVMYGSGNEKMLYRALIDIPTAEDFTAAHWEQVTVDELINALEDVALAAYPTANASGSVAAFTDGADNVPVKTLSIAIESQTGVTGTIITQNGKNLLHDTLQSRTGDNKDNGFDVVVSDDGSFTVSGTRIANTHTRVVGVMYLQPGDYILTGCPANSGANKWRLRVGLGNGESTTNVGSDYGNGFAFTVQTAAYYTINYLIETTESVNLAFYPMVRAAGISNAAFEPYTVNTYEVDWTSEPGAITDGTLDVINGVLNTGGQDYEVTPVDVRTMLGNNTIYADCGGVSVTYRADPTLQHDNLDAGDVGFTSNTGVYGNGTIGKAVRTLEGDLFMAQNSIDRLETAIIGNKMLIFNSDGSVTWEEAPS